jgi:signal recognition particle subunit SEC65
LSKQRGNKTNAVKAIRVGFRSVPKRVEKVSAKTMLKAVQAINVLAVADHVGIHEDPSPTLFDQASRYEVAPVYAQVRPMIEKPYAERIPIIIIKTAAGIRAEGASPKAATPLVRKSWQDI